MARKPAPIPEEERKLISSKQVEARRRGVVLKRLIGVTDDDDVIHIPTGFTIFPPYGADGERRQVDPRAYAEHLLKADPEGWEASRNYKFGEKLRPSLHDRLMQTAYSFP